MAMEHKFVLEHSASAAADHMTKLSGDGFILHSWHPMAEGGIAALMVKPVPQEAPEPKAMMGRRGHSVG